jgi:hypothetical protein
MLLVLSPNGSGRPEEFLGISGLSPEDLLELMITRTAVLKKSGDIYNDPFGTQFVLDM